MEFNGLDLLAYVAAFFFFVWLSEKFFDKGNK